MAATRILVVDDDALIRVNMVEMLTRMGYEVVGEADDAAGAVQQARDLTPDLVIMDIRMPGEEDGIRRRRDPDRREHCPDVADQRLQPARLCGAGQRGGRGRLPGQAGHGGPFAPGD